MNSDIIERLLNLPVNIKTALLNQMSFLDLLDFCQKNPDLCSQIISSPEYFQQRLVSYYIEPSFYRLLLSNNYQPQDAYVGAVVKSNSIMSDPSILVYLDNSSILLPGLEHYIGFVKTGLRAIDQNNGPVLLYLLKMLPSYEERNTILGALYLKYMDSITFNQQPKIFSRDFLENLFRQVELNPDISSSGRYYPYNLQTYEAYRLGTSGLPFPLFIFDRFINQQYEAYLYGLVDGKHDQMFISEFSKYQNMFEGTRGVIHTPAGGTFSKKTEIRTYVAMNGTREMMEAAMKSTDLHGKAGPASYISEAIAGNNFFVTEYILSQFNLTAIANIMQVRRVSDIVPLSEEMAELLEHYGIPMPLERRFLGAMETGNYEWLLTMFGKSQIIKVPNDLDATLMTSMSSGPPYLMTLYLSKFRNMYGGDFLEYLMTSYLIPVRDLYREEILLKLGYKPSPAIVAEIKEELASVEETSLFTFPIEQYPNLASYMDSTRV